jgi:hypothetical protein
MKIKRSIRIAAGVAALLMPASAYADETGGCHSFAWPVTTELQWLKAADSQPVSSGSTLKEPPSKAIKLALLPMDKVAFPVAPTSRRKSNGGDRYGGFVTFDSVGQPGIYQVSLPMAGWVDVIQDGKAIKSAAHTGKMDCDGVRKSVRFDIGPGPVTVEISGIPESSAKFAIRRGE